MEIKLFDFLEVLVMVDYSCRLFAGLLQFGSFLFTMGFFFFLSVLRDFWHMLFSDYIMIILYNAGLAHHMIIEL